VSPSTKSPTVALTERDHELLVSLLKYRYLSTSQLQRLHFPSLQTAARRLRLLAEAGYVISFRPKASDDRLATLARLGAETVANRLGVPLSELGWDARREKPKDYLFLEHFLATGDFRISLTRACAHSEDVRLLGFLPEHLVERTPKGAVRKYVRDVIADVTDHRQKLTHAPDGVFALERGGTAALFFLEVDRGTEVLTNPSRGFLKIVRFYLSAIVSNSYQRYQADFGATKPFNAFRVLVVTSSPERLANIRSICGRTPFEPAHAKRFLWLTTDDALRDDALLTRSWSSIDPTDTRDYLLAPGQPRTP
jgi:hypothetical protein